jgi:hypothetical protein
MSLQSTEYIKNNETVDKPAKLVKEEDKVKEVTILQDKYNVPAANPDKPDIKKTVFWSKNPNVLFDKDHILEFFPVESMTYEERLNAISRTVLVLTIVLFAFTRNLRILVISGITLFAIFLMYFYQEREKRKMLNKKENLEKLKDGFMREGYENVGLATLRETGQPVPRDTFVEPNASNPFGNVLMTDYDYNPNKKPAPPSYNAAVNNDILTQAKRLVIESNPDQPDIADKLFTDLGDKYVFEQSLRPFNSTASTTIPNDQAAFADFCYGSMVSCKEGNMFACARNLSRHIN